MTTIDPQLDVSLLSSRVEFAGVPFIDQYAGVWALFEPHARVLLGQAENINLQLHLEQHAPQPTAGSAMGTSGLSDVRVTRDGIAIVELRGTLMKQVSSFSGGTSTVRARRQIRAAAASDEVEGIFVVIDSPGGTVAGTADLAADIRAAGSKKPCFAFSEDLCASAAYWFGSQCHRLTAGASALVGSIGVFSVIYDMSKMAEKEGVKVHVVRFGEFKGAGTPGTEITEEQLARWQRITDAHGEDFVNAVAAGRKLAIDKAKLLADGDIHKGSAALDKKLIDAVETQDEAYAALIAEIKKPSSKNRGTRMSKDPAELTATLSELRPAEASLSDLRDACPGASSDFLLSQLEKKATVAEAMKAHSQALADANAALAKERDELKAKATETEHKKRGAAPVAAGKDEDEASDEPWSDLGANEFMRIQVADRVAKGQDRALATKAMFAAYPGLQSAMVAAANERRKH